MRSLFRWMPGPLHAAIALRLSKLYVSLGRYLRTLGVVPLALAGGSTAAPPTGDTGGGLTLAQLREEMRKTASEAVGPLVQAALEPFTKSNGDLATAITLLTKKADPEPATIEKNLGSYPLGRKMRALALARIEVGREIKGNPDDIDAAIAAVKKHWRRSDGDATEKWLQHAKTTILAGNAQVAGDMIMPEFDPEWIALLRNNAVIRAICRTLPMPRGATTRRRQTDAATAYYQGETDKMTPSNLKVGRVNLSYKKLTALSVVSNDLIRFTAGDADRIVQEDLIRVMALREDRAFLLGNPLGNATDAGAPQGIRYQTNAAHIVTSAGTSLANFQSDLTGAIEKLETANIPVTTENTYWVMSPKTFWTIYALTTTTGDWVFRDELIRGYLLGYPIRKTTQLAIGNSWIGANSGLIALVHGPSMEIHDSMQRTISVFPGGAYYDPVSATVLSGISQDETVITCISEHDFLQVYDKAAVFITGYNS